MLKLTSPIVVLAALAIILAGCGGGGGKSTSSSGTSSGGTIDGVKVGNCLNENDDFLVQPSTKVLSGMSPAGVSFTLTIYPTTQAAQAALAKKNPKTSAIVETAVIDFTGNPSPYKGAPPAKISKVELNDIKACIDSSK